MHCQRCHNMMFPTALFDEAGGLVENTGLAWRCFACGDIIDPLICLNRGRVSHPEGEQLKRGAWHSVGIGAAP